MYDPKNGFVHPKTQVFKLFFSQVPYGFGLFLVIAGAELAYKKFFGSHDDHHAHH
jgi:hypothetical protein